MEHSVPASYLGTEVLTATPQKLQLMLVEGAIRFGRRAGQCWNAGADEEGCEALVRAQQIVTELISSLNREASPELVKKLGAVYLFVFRALMEANMEHDRKKLDDALTVLEVERQTWREVCEKLGSSTQPESPPAVDLSSHPSAVPGPPAIGDFPHGPATTDNPSSRLSLEA